MTHDINFKLFTVDTLKMFVKAFPFQQGLVKSIFEIKNNNIVYYVLPSGTATL